MKSLKDKKELVITYTVIFLFFLGYSMVIASSITPVYILSKSNLSLFGFGDLFITIFGKTSVITLPFLILFFLNYTRIINTDSLTRVLIVIIKRTLMFLLIIYIVIFISYLLTHGNNPINFGFADRSALSLIMPAYLAILLSFLLQLFYLVGFSLIAGIVEILTNKSWLAVLSAISLSYLDTGLRIVLNSTKYIGILPSDNVLVFYLDDFFYRVERPPIILSILYWIIFITILYSIQLLVYKKRYRKGMLNNEIV